MEEAALVLRRVVLTESRKSDMPWPPPNGKVMKDISPLPDILYNFGHVLISGKKRECVVKSLCYDIMYAVTNGQWVTSRHMLLAVTLWHLTGKAEIITLINQLGHCISYSRVLKALTAV